LRWEFRFKGDLEIVGSSYVFYGESVELLVVEILPEKLLLFLVNQALCC
jgi:hypothetical protein